MFGCGINGDDLRPCIYRYVVISCHQDTLFDDMLVGEVVPSSIM